MLRDTALLQQNQCYHCRREIVGVPSICADCRVVEYCSEQHKTAGRRAHQSQCEATQQLLATRDSQAYILRGDPDGDVFESTSVFWSISDTRPYTEACVSLVERLSQIPTVKACEAAIKQGIEWLELNWGVDHRDVKYRVPALQIRLGNDQDAYDFMKWYATTGTDSSYSWVELYDLENEDALESLQAGRWIDDETHLSTMASVTLIKLRIWFNLTSLHNAGLLAKKMPQELLDYIREVFIATGIVAGAQQIMRDISSGKDIESLYIRPLDQQLNDLFSAVERKNVDFWPIIVGRQDLAVIEDPNDDEWELNVAVSAVRTAWEETPGAIDWIQSQLQHQAIRNSTAT